MRLGPSGAPRAPPPGARPRPPARAQVGKRRSAGAPPPGATAQAPAGAARSRVPGTWGRREVSAGRRARPGSRQPDSGPRRGRGVAPEHALGRRCAAGEGAGAAGHSGPTWAEPEARDRGSNRTGPLDRVSRPLGRSSDKTPQGSLGHGSPEVGACRLGRSLKSREEERGPPQGRTAQSRLLPRSAWNSYLPLPSPFSWVSSRGRGGVCPFSLAEVETGAGGWAHSQAGPELRNWTQDS